MWFTHTINSYFPFVNTCLQIWSNELKVCNLLFVLTAQDLFRQFLHLDRRVYAICHPRATFIYNKIRAANNRSKVAA